MLVEKLRKVLGGKTTTHGISKPQGDVYVPQSSGGGLLTSLVDEHILIHLLLVDIPKLNMMASKVVNCLWTKLNCNVQTCSLWSSLKWRVRPQEYALSSWDLVETKTDVMMLTKEELFLCSSFKEGITVFKFRHFNQNQIRIKCLAFKDE